MLMHIQVDVRMFNSDSNAEEANIGEIQKILSMLKLIKLA